MPEVLILSGPPGSGKTTVAKALAERYDRVAHIDVDVVRHFVTPTGFAQPSNPERKHQRLLGIRNACALAHNFLLERFGVIIEDVIEDADFLPLYLSELEPAGFPVHVVHLLPGIEAYERRVVARGRTPDAARWVREDYQRYVAVTQATPGAVIDSSDLSPAQTADRLQALTTAGESLIWQPEPGKTAESNAR